MNVPRACDGAHRPPQTDSHWLNSNDERNVYGTCRGCDSEQRVRDDGLIVWHEPVRD